MFGEDYKNRLNIQQVCNFFLVGTDDFQNIDETPEERSKQYSKALSNGLRKFRDRVAEINWETISDEKKRNIKTEDLCQEILDANANSEYLNYEMGFRAGLLFAHDLLK